MTGIQSGFPKSGLGGVHICWFKSTDNYRSGGPVEVIGKVCICFQISEKWEKFFVTPFVISPSCPGVIIFGDTSQKHLPIYRAGSSSDFAAGYHHRLCDRCRLSKKLPVVITHHYIGSRCISVSDFIGQLFYFIIVRSCFN